LAVGASVEVGRGSEVGVRVDRRTLSRRHFRVRVDASAAWIHDLGSVNGTMLNGARLPAHVPVPLEIGAVIEAAGVFFILRNDEPPAAPPSLVASAAAPERPVVVAAPAMLRLHELVGVIARSTIPAILVGETGVGKEILSTAVHARSPRARNPLVRINCAALPDSLLESELFGFEKGAFTGAVCAKPGLIESAEGGSFLFDEIGEMPIGIQAKLLRVLESNLVTRLGGLRPRTVDVRFIAATSRDLHELVAAGRFRKDLYYRLDGITIRVPPLRERAEEIPGLARLFASEASSAMGRDALAISAEAISILCAHPWPGNVRQLKNVIDRAVALCTGPEIGVHHIALDPMPLAPDALARPPPAPALGGMRVDPDDDRRSILAALEQARGNQGQAAEILGVSRKTLMRWLDAHGLRRPRKGAGATARQLSRACGPR
jgi:transcriptional regulator with PAS, ATPase and Fis domain